MIDYSVHMIARSEHEHMQHSLAPVSDFAVCAQTRQPGRASRQIGKLLQTVGNAVAYLGSQLDSQQDNTFDADLASAQVSEAAR